MKKSIFSMLFVLLIALIYLAFLILSVFGVIFPFYKNWFSFGLIALSLTLFPRYVFYGIDTNLWVGLVLILCGAFGIVSEFYKLNLVYNFVGYIFSFGISSLIIFLFFRQIFHLKIFTFALLFDIILVVYANGLLSLWAMISLLVLTAVIATIFAVKAIISNTRKVWNFLIKKMVIIRKK